MKSGIYWGYVGLSEGLTARIRAEYGRPLRVIATGGLATLYAEAAPVIEVVDPDLTLRGLRLIHAANSRARIEDYSHGQKIILRTQSRSPGPLISTDRPPRRDRQSLSPKT